MQKWMLLCFGILLGLSTTLPAHAQRLNPEGKELLEQGIAAAKSEAWDLALEQLRRANFSGPREWHYRYPEVLYSQGVVYASAGDEIPAIIHFELYLANTPNAANAQAVRSEIRKLDIRGQAKAEKVFRSIVETVLSSVGGRWQKINTIAIQPATSCDVLRIVAYGVSRLGRAHDAQQTATLANCPDPNRNWGTDDYFSEIREDVLNFNYAMSQATYQDVQHAAWMRLLDKTHRTGNSNENHIYGTSKLLLKATVAKLEDVPYELYSVAGGVSTWLPRIRSLRQELERFRIEWTQLKQR